MHFSGKTINLISEDYTASIVTMGGAIACLKYKGKHITMPFKPEYLPMGHHGKILAPWPNRVIDGLYTYNGVKYQLPINDIPNNCALHGLVAWKEWEIVNMNTDSVELSTYVDPTPYYPFLVKLNARYEVIDGMGLKIDLQALNVGHDTAPYGVGMHPLLTCNLLDLGKCKLSMPFKQCFSLNERKCPVENVAVEDVGFDYSTPKLMGDLHIDHCFIANGNQRVNTVMLEGNHLQVYLKTSAPYLQIYCPEQYKRLCLAVEPMSCAPNAFNNHIGLIELKEQQYYTLNYIIGAFEH